MLDRIIRYSLHNRLAVLAVALLLLFGGAYVAHDIDVDVFPDLTAPTVVVMTEAKGMAPEEVEQLVTFPIETSVNGAAGVRRVRSSSTTGFSIVWVEFDWGTEIYRARQTVSEKLAEVRERLPRDAGNPTLGPQSSILGEMMIVCLTADSTSLRDLHTMAQWDIRPRLMATGGVAQVAVAGGETMEYQILLNPDRMRHYGILLDDVINAVDGMNQNRTGGITNAYGNEYILRGMLSTTDVEAMGEAAVRNDSGTVVRLHDIAEVKAGNRSPKTGAASFNGKPAVLLTVTKQPETSTLLLTEDIDSLLKDVQRRLPPDVHISTDVYRQSRFIESSIGNVKQALVEGGFFVVVVLFVFLLNVRTTFISLVTIPLSLLAALLALHFMGMTVNTMSLGGMCIAIGSLVDDAIVDVENVFRRLRENRLLPAGRRRAVLTVVYEASREVRLPVLYSTLIIIASFMPLFFLSGMEGRMLKPLGIAFITALAASTLVALTVTPVLCSFLLKKKETAAAPEETGTTAGKTDGMGENGTAREEKASPVAAAMGRGYATVLAPALRHKRAVLLSAASAFAIAFALLLLSGRSFLPPFNEGSFTINVSTLPGISLEESDRIGRLAEEKLMEIPEIKAVGRKTGRAELDEHALGVNVSEIEAPFELAGRPKDEVAADVRNRLATLPGVNVEVGAPITHRIDAMLSGTRASIAVKIFGPDLNRLFALGNEIKAAADDIEGIADLNVEQQVERPQLKIIPRRTMLAKYGITMPEFGRMVGVLLGGETVSQVYEGNRTTDLVLKVDDTHRMSAEEMAMMSVDADEKKIPLGDIAEIVSATGPNTINRENVSRKVVVSANVAGRDLRGVVNDIRQRVEESVTLPDGYHVEYGGQFESEQAASQTLLVMSCCSLVVIFLLLYGQFRSARQAAVILLNLPLALIGGIVAVWATSGVVSIPSVIGFISLFGIATRNGMLLVSRYNDLRRQGFTPEESVRRGSADRLNPIIMTALTSALALIPMVAGGDLPGNEIQSPMAVVILGGLVSSTLLNAFVVPAAYLLFLADE